jgi:hypothetical protein
LKIEEIVSEWDKDSKIDETELSTEAVNIPKIHNKYLKIFMGERISLFRLKAEKNRVRKTLQEYYLGELDKHELEELGRDQFYKKLLKNEIDVYIESDDLFIETTLKVAMQQEKVDYIERVIKSLDNRGFAIKNAIDFMKFTMG